MNLVKHKTIYFIFSLALLIPGLIALWLWGLNLSIDFTGGSRIIYVSEENSPENIERLRGVIEDQGIEISTVQPSVGQVIIRTHPIDEKKAKTIEEEIAKNDLPFVLEQFETIGPVVGRETTLNALKAVGVSSFLIVLYIAWSFRKVPRPTSSWRFGVTAVITLLHDVLILVGLFAILGHFFNVEIDSLFITALLTVMGFSVHDTIVVFDRIRESLLKNNTGSFSDVVNSSILQTLTRSVNTSITSLLVLFTLLLFGGDTIRWFILALFVGILVGTYSSIFNAAQLLVLWQELEVKFRRRSFKATSN